MAGELDPSSLARAYQQAASYLGLGVEFVVSLLVGLFAGRWLDGKLGTHPWLMLVGILLGTVAGFVNFFQRVMQLQKKQTPGPDDGKRK